MLASKANFTKVSPLIETKRPGVIVAALDMGSNSFHLVVARGHSRGHFEVLLKEKVMMRLGDEVASTKRISPSSTVLIKEVIATMANLARGVGATEMVALATAAFRDAKNAGAIVDEIEESLGIKVSVISGRKEAELIFEAISHAVDFGHQVVIGADLGGGSMEVTVGTQDELFGAESFAVGVGRLTTNFISVKSPSGIDTAALAGHLDAVLVERLKALRSEYSPATLVLSSGSFLNIARMALIRDGGPSYLEASINQATVPLEAILSVNRDLLQMDAKARSKLTGIDDKRLDLLPAAAVVLNTLLATLKPKSVLACEWALREGIILRELAQRSVVEFEGDENSIKEASVLAIAARYGWNEGHARQVAELALSLFDQTREVHLLGDAEREMLYHAALVHDIGEYISVEGHDRHGAYLLENSRLPGFDMEEKNQLVSVVRYHRRGTPKSEYAPYAALAKASASKVTKLAAILRLADALDRSHTRLINAIEVQLKPKQVLIFVSASEEVELEEYGLRRKRQLFEDLFERSVHLVQDGREIAPRLGAN